MSALLIWGDIHWSAFKTVRSSIELLISPIYQVVDLPFHVYQQGGHYLSSKQLLIEENDHLQHKILQLESKIQQLQALQTENDRLNDLLSSSSKKAEHVTVGRLLKVQIDPFSQQVIVNQGALNGAFSGQPVIDKNGLIGIVKNVGSLASRVLLITDPSMGVPVEASRSGARSIAVGTGNPYDLELRHVPETADFKVGDALVTSGLGGQFYPGYQVGTITQISRDPTQSFVNISVKPSAEFLHLREVLLLGTQQSFHQLSKPLQSLESRAAEGAEG